MPRFACPHCSLVLEDDGSLAGRTVACPQCRTNFLWPEAQPVPVATPQPQVHVHYDNVNNQGIAAVLSLFWPGAGQIYNGAIGSGLCVMLLWVIAVFLSFFCIGLVVAIPLWIWSIYDAYNGAAQATGHRAKWS
jgi:TM2 domain-containing membrane protein YozV